MRHRFLGFLTVLLLGLSAVSGSAFAQEGDKQETPPPKPTYYDDQGEPYGSKYFLARPDRVFVSLQRREDLPADYFILRVSLDNAMSGCPKMSKMSADVEFVDRILEIEVFDYSVDMRGLPQNPHYECGGAQEVPAAEIVLGKEELLKRNTDMIRMRLGKLTDFFDVDISEDWVMISPAQRTGALNKFYQPLRMPGVINPLRLWFYPENTVILTVPDANKQGGSSKGLSEAASRMGLVPLTDIIYDFKSPLAAGGHYYYVDEKGDVAAKVPQGVRRKIGSIAVEKTVYGLEGDEVVTEQTDIFARRPGPYE